MQALVRAARGVALGTMMLGALGACEGDAGPMGPQGPQGPPGPQGAPGPSGSLLSITGTLDGFGEASRELPAETGNSSVPPVVTCWISDPTIGPAWIQVNGGASGSCGIGRLNSGLWAVGIVSGPAGWNYMFVVAY